MRNSDKYLNIKTFVIVSGLLCLLYSVLFHPITYEAQGDSQAYMELAKQIFNLPGAGTNYLSHRSPLYSVLLGIFVKIFGEAHFLYPVMIFQYVLIFLSSILIYRIFHSMTENITVAFIAGITGIVNLTTIYFGYMILTETVALFLYTLTIYMLFRYFQQDKFLLSFITGLTVALLVLTRFNTLGIPLVIIFGYAFYYFIRSGFSEIKRFLTGVSLFTFAVLIILNLWAFYNYKTVGIYELLPKHHTGQRWAVPGTINESNKVGTEYEEVLKIFLKSREELKSNDPETVSRKGSLLSNQFFKGLNDFFRPEVSGFLLYRNSEAGLLRYFHLENTPENIRLLNEKLKPFYKIIEEQNRDELARLRIYSFIYTFKHISPTLPGSTNVNLNILPSQILKGYKPFFIMMVLTVYLGSVLHVIYLLFRKEKMKEGVNWIILYSLIWYFPAVNWYANVLGDANRFRFPADMVIIGIFVTYCYSLILLVRKHFKVNGRAQEKNS